MAGSIFENKMQKQLVNSDFAVLYRTNSQSRAIEDALRKRDIPYRIFGGLSFYQRKEIKDLLSYLRLIINPKDEEALRRVINFPARGIGQTTMDRLTIAANEYNKSLFEIIENLDRLNLKINSGTKRKLEEFVNMIKSFQIINQESDAFILTEHVVKKSGLLLEYKKDGTPEGVARIENLEELLNGIKDFVEGQRELADAKGDLTEFLEDVALATDQDKDTGEGDRVSLMTIHLAKGLEFPYVYIVGLEEDLFPSALSMNTRSELEEERRLFYVALTRAEKQAYITYTQNRYRWGKLIDAEPSRFIEEIDAAFVEDLTPTQSYRFKPLVSPDIFGTNGGSPVKSKKTGNSFMPRENQLRKLRKLKPTISQPIGNVSETNIDLQVGTLVNHTRFGKGKVIKLEGNGHDKKAEIQFERGDVKKLLLRFAKLEIL